MTWLSEEIKEIDKLNISATLKATLQVCAIFENYKRRGGSYEKFKNELKK